MKNMALIPSVWFALSIVAVAQMQMPAPGPEVKKLDYFAGSWTLNGDLKAGAMGPSSPGGTITENEKCEWMEGNFYLVCHTDFKGSMGNGTGLSILGYSTNDKAYTYREFNSWGEFDDSRGSLDSDKWTWNSDENFGGTPMKGRFTMKITSPTTYDFAFDVSPDGSKWTTVMDGKATKSK
jgi:Protein of unknown function (DUF1579)